MYALSAGGTSANLQIFAFGSEKEVPFQTVWAMSGPPETALNMSSDATEVHTRNVAKSVGCAQDGDEEMLECLRDVPIEMLRGKVLEYSVENHPPAGLFTFISSVDGDLFGGRPSEVYKTRRVGQGMLWVGLLDGCGLTGLGIAIVLGWTQDDGAMNVGPAHLIQDEGGMKIAIRNFAHSLDDTDFSPLTSSRSTQLPTLNRNSHLTTLTNNQQTQSSRSTSSASHKSYATCSSHAPPSTSLKPSPPRPVCFSTRLTKVCSRRCFVPRECRTSTCRTAWTRTTSSTACFRRERSRTKTRH